MHCIWIKICISVKKNIPLISKFLHFYFHWCFFVIRSTMVRRDESFPCSGDFVLLLTKYNREIKYFKLSRALVVVILWLLDLQLPVQSVPITCLRRPLFLCPKGDLLIQVWLHICLYSTNLLETNHGWSWWEGVYKEKIQSTYLY